jgi:hypothetical protein
LVTSAALEAYCVVAQANLRSLNGVPAHKIAVIWLTAAVFDAVFGLVGKSNADLHR